MEKSLSRSFKEIYQTRPEVLSFAPGRVNVIGEHTDYNLGYVLPAALNLRNYFVASRRKDEKVFLWAENFKQKEEFSIERISFSEKNRWANYIKGIFWVLEKEGYGLQGIDAFIWGDIPLDAGLSSSAALEVSVIHGLKALFKLELTPKKMARLAQKAENDFVGVKCGLMDQFISVLGEENKALFLDCETLRYELIPLYLEKAALGIVIYDSGVRRELASSEYNKRRIEASSALDVLKKYGIKGYKDVDFKMLEERRKEMDEVLYKRAKHIVSENERVREAVEALRNNNLSLLGEILFHSHESLRDDYEVSCPELDLLYEVAKEFSGSVGARLTGAGFGGSGLALVEKKKIPTFKERIFKEAKDRGYIQPKLYEIEIGEGAKAYWLDKKEGK
ncbi:MAG: galactokinase [Candidatus Aminicenantes bacterium]|nr:MAG: galactokinase [Candidatus Aminicenantes bacterium]